jgi:hypothetical protein
MTAPKALLVLAMVFSSTHIYAQEACSIAFVHLGPDLPSYINSAVFQARLFNPAEDIYLLANQKALNKKEVQLFLNHMRNNLEVKIIPIGTLHKSEEHKIFEEKSTHNKKFRNGFWRFTTERFLVLDDFMQQNNITDLVHLENDTLLYRSLEELMPHFRAYYQGIAAVLNNDKLCIPCFVYIRDKKAIKKLARYIAQHAQEGKNDMITLASFKNSNPTTLIDSLPIISRAYVTQYGLRSTSGLSSHNPPKFYNHIDAFRSVFDGNAIGLYLGGVSHNNKPAEPGFITPDCLFNPSLLDYQWEKDELGRSIPFMIFKGEQYRINNLHVYSKNLKKFLSLECPSTFP